MTLEFSEQVKFALADPGARITVLTGAGISAESGIPTFRGPEGYWTVGSRVYMPEEVATWQMFARHPGEVWEWYLYRLGVCLHAEPNAGHEALVLMEKSLGDRFTLITQNIDNLHIRAGNTLDRTFQIHGNINYTRCSAACTDKLLPLPGPLKTQRSEKGLAEEEIHLLMCETCGEWLRPHVLWFDESYDEEYFRFNSSMQVAERTSLLIVVGTSGATTLPNYLVSMVHQNRGTIIDINPQRNPFSDLAENSPGGSFIQMSASEALKDLAETCEKALK